jgi:hypothetical protein
LRTAGRAAHRRLGDAELLGRAGHRAERQHALEGDEQVQVDLTQIHAFHA